MSGLDDLRPEIAEIRARLAALGVSVEPEEPEDLDEEPEEGVLRVIDGVPVRTFPPTRASCGSTRAARRVGGV